MSAQLNITAAYNYASAVVGSVSPGDSLTNLAVTPASSGKIEDEIVSSTADTALPLGGLSSLGYGWFRNLDPTNNLKIKSATSGTVLALLTPARPVALIPFDTTITAPSFQASAGTPLLRYALFPP